MMVPNVADIATQNETAKRMFCLEKAMQTHGPGADSQAILKTAGDYVQFISPAASRIVTPR
jgi:hypothetical protein